MMLESKYVYDDLFDSTVAEHTDARRFLGVQPAATGEFMLLFGTKGGDGTEKGRCDIYVTGDELEAFIADLQRARSGCFRGRWPRPEPMRDLGHFVSAAPRHRIEGTVQGVVAFLEENYSAAESVAVDITPAMA